jgi:hypothetical protein
LGKHPTFRALILELEQSPLVLPVFEISDIEAADSVAELAASAAEQINSSGARPITAEQVLQTMREWATRTSPGSARTRHS